jgi:hypothetical protein
MTVAGSQANVLGKAKTTTADKSSHDFDIQTQDSLDETKELLLKSYPGKLLFSIKETASILGVSYEFVRQKIQSGDVKTKQFSTRKLIHLNELTKLIIQGIPL